MEIQKKQSGLEIAAFVLGIVGMLTTCIVIGILPCIIGLIFSIVVLCNKHSNNGLAIAGLVCSIIGIIVFGLFFFVVNLPNEEKKSENKDAMTEETISMPKPTNKSTPAPTSEQEYEFEYDKMNVKYLRHEVTKDSIERKVLIVYYEFTNNSDENKIFDYSFTDKCFQNGVEVEHSWWHANEQSKNSGKEIKPGTTVEVSSSFVLGDSMDDVLLEIEPWISFNEKILLSINLRLE